MHSKKMLVTLAVFVAVASSAAAQEFPAKAVRVIAPFSPGGATDALARLVSQKLSERWHHQVIVDNRPGAGGNIGAELAARAAPDGYTLVVAGAPHAINMTLYTRLSYDLQKDLVGVNRIASYPSAIVVHPSLPVKTVQELIALAKKRPGDLNFGSAGPGSPNRLAIELFMMMAEVKMVHVPYKGGSGQMVGELLAGQVQLASIGLPPSMGYINAGRLRAVAVTGMSRSPLLPNVPTVHEAGLPGFDVTSWYGMFAPAALPRNLVTKINGDIAAILDMSDMKQRLEKLGADPAPQSPEEFAKFVRAEVEKWSKVVKESGAKVD
ncbi:MAG: tripartite tricarboxylate transporter substrate binding protein [Betaproteobacteria bacterium]|nr:tripartite tricarboxylate transporter substrate binding protein [Betaproteobacteria bacterium]